MDKLVEEYRTWLKEQGLPDGCAEEMLCNDITQAQRTWLNDFIERWDALEEAIDRGQVAS